MVRVIKKATIPYPEKFTLGTLGSMPRSSLDQDDDRQNSTVWSYIPNGALDTPSHGAVGLWQLVWDLRGSARKVV